MSWSSMPKFRPLHPQHIEWLNNLCENLQYLYDNIVSKSFAIPEPSRHDAKGDYEDNEWDDAEEWEDVDEIGLEYVFLYDGVRRYLWYRYALRDGEEPKDLPHLTFGHDFGSSRRELGFSLNPTNGGDAWNVQDLVQVRQLIPGMILSVHTVRCAMLREVSE